MIPIVWRSCATALAVVGLAALVVGCSGSKPEPACPEGVIPVDGGKITRFRDGPGRDLTDVLVSARIYGVLADQCEYEKNAVTIHNFQIGFAADRGPADRSKVADFQYWVAIVDPERKILTRKDFSVHIEFPENLTRVSKVIDNLEVRIPMPDVMKAPRYQVIVSFQLTPDELAWNRSQRAGRE